MSYRFRFASLLELRRRERDEAGSRVGEANEAIARVDQRVREIEIEREQNRSNESKTRSGNLSVDQLLARGRYDMQLAAEIHSLAETRVKLNVALGQRQDQLREAETEVKKFERLEELERARYKAQTDKREQGEIDETNCRKFTMLGQLRDRQREASGGTAT